MNTKYFEARGEDERAFWASDGSKGLFAAAWAWQTGPAWWYLARALTFRLFWPMVKRAVFVTAITVMAIYAIWLGVAA